MNDGYWESVPDEYIEEWANIFLNSMEGPDLSACCPICHHKELHRYYQTGRTMKVLECSGFNIVKGAEWQWCSCCRTYEHVQVKIPDWWIPKLEIDGNKVEKNLAPGEVIKVDTGNVVAFEKSVNYEIETVKGLKNIFFGGEGLFLTKLTGPGRIILQTQNFNEFAGRIARFIPSK